MGCSTAEHTVAQCTELFGFGSGDFVKGGEANDLMSAAEARWLRYAFEKGDDLVILEKQRSSPEHLGGASFFNKASFFRFSLSLSIKAPRPPDDNDLT